ncbi:3422_t:CDS:2 [Cetraspora pellucida]|uniref:3422_t:CDS:1 n=1 Tax=Cetraspora pellucida TaxID=1433469 RepID=A0ACA9LCP9_9GLOM|nr:3422_t:CDS:2 [Cetraspora pellucida]
MENDFGSQEISSDMAARTVMRDEAEKSQKQSLKNSLDRLTIDTLKVVCRGEGLFESGTKKDLVERLADRVLSKAKGKDRVTDSVQVGNMKESRCEGRIWELFGFDQQYVALEKLIEKMMQAMVRKVVEEIKKSIQPVQKNIAAEIGDKSMDDSMKALFYNKLANERQTIKNK